MRCASCLDANGRTRMALLLLWRATMMYWLPLHARGSNRLVLSVKMLLMGSLWNSTLLALLGLASLGLSGLCSGAAVVAGVCIERMCWRG